MYIKTKNLSILCVIVILTVMTASSALAGQTEPPPPGAEPAGEGAGPGIPDADWQVAYHAETGKVRFLTTNSGVAIPQPQALAEGANPEMAARSFLQSYGELFGLRSQADELVVKKLRTSDVDVLEGRPRSFVRFQQVYQGIPVLGAELNVELDANQDVLAVNGELLPGLGLNTLPTISAEAAREIALAEVARDYGLDVKELTTSSPELWVYNPLLLGSPGPRLNTLVWRIDVEPRELLPIRELVLVDAQLGAVPLRFNQVDTARNRSTYDANNGLSLPGTLECNESNPTCSGGDAHAVAAHVYAGDTYDFISPSMAATASTMRVWH